MEEAEHEDEDGEESGEEDSASPAFCLASEPFASLVVVVCHFLFLFFPLVRLPVDA